MVMKLDEDDPLVDEPLLLDEPLLDEPPEDALPPLDNPPALAPAVDPEVPDAVPVVDEVELDPVDALVDEPDPVTDSPTELLTAVTVPLISAVSVVPASVF